jgi:hypothetical protein
MQRVLFPWPRADCAAAAAYVLAHHEPGETVAANHWEYAYYFRHLGSRLILLNGAPHRFPNRLWLVITAATPVDRQAVVRELSVGAWHIVDQREFARTSVFHLSRQDEIVQEIMDPDRRIR